MTSIVDGPKLVTSAGVLTVKHSASRWAQEHDKVKWRLTGRMGDLIDEGSESLAAGDHIVLEAVYAAIDAIEDLAMNPEVYGIIPPEEHRLPIFCSRFDDLRVFTPFPEGDDDGA